MVVVGVSVVVAAAVSAAEAVVVVVVVVASVEEARRRQEMRGSWTKACFVVMLDDGGGEYICIYVHICLSISKTCLEHGEEGVAVLSEEGQHPLAGDAEAPCGGCFLGGVVCVFVRHVAHTDRRPYQSDRKGKQKQKHGTK